MCHKDKNILLHFPSTYRKKIKINFYRTFVRMENMEQLTEAMHLLIHQYEVLHRACRKTYENDTTQRIHGVKAALRRGDCGILRLTKALELMISRAATDENKAAAEAIIDIYLDIVRIESKALIRALW